MQLRLIPLLLATLLFATGCATYQAPRPVNDSTWLKNALSLTRNDLTVSVALPDDRQTEDHFGLPLQKGKVQPVWVRVTNPSSRAYWLLPAYTDPKYYSSAEVSHRFRRFLTSTETAQRQAMRIEELIFDTYIPPGSDQSGFIYTRYDEGSQVFSIALLSTGSLQRFDFLVPTARLRTDHLALSGSGKNGETRQVLAIIPTYLTWPICAKACRACRAQPRTLGGLRPATRSIFLLLALGTSCSPHSFPLAGMKQSFWILIRR